MDFSPTPNPIPTKREEISTELEKKAKEILEKHLDGRNYIESKIDNWINLILNDIENYFKEKYPSYNLFAFCDIFSSNTSFYSDYTTICRISTDNSCLAIFKTDNIYSCLYLFFFKDFTSNQCFSLLPKIVSTGNKLLYEIFDERSYNKKFSEYSKRLNNEHIQQILKINTSKNIFFLTLSIKKPNINFSFNYRTVYNNNTYNINEIIQTFFTTDTEILHLIYVFSNDKN